MEAFGCFTVKRRDENGKPTVILIVLPEVTKSNASMGKLRGKSGDKVFNKGLQLLWVFRRVLQAGFLGDTGGYAVNEVSWCCFLSNHLFSLDGVLIIAQEDKNKTVKNGSEENKSILPTQHRSFGKADRFASCLQHGIQSVYVSYQIGLKQVPAQRGWKRTVFLLHHQA